VSFFPHQEIEFLVETYGAGLVGVLATAEAIGLPVPAEASLVMAAVYAGSTGRLSILAVIGAALGGIFAGQMIGYTLGRTVGATIVHRWGPRIGLTEDRLMLGRYLFRHHGAKVIVFGHFVVVLRTLGAIMAGINDMPWRRFVLADLVGGCLWVSAYGFGAFWMGQGMEAYARYGALLVGTIALIAMAIGMAIVRRSERRLIAVARREEEPA
jgi:membrane protein DedA with SNARE-associated domain